MFLKAMHVVYVVLKPTALMNNTATYACTELTMSFGTLLCGVFFPPTVFHMILLLRLELDEAFRNVV